MYRRRSEEGSVTPTQENRDVFDDEFAVDDFDLVADGFRPESAREGDERHSQDPPIHTTSAHYATDPDLITPTAPAPNRNSISKTRSDENPFASPEDGPRMDFERSPSIHSQSTASFAPGIARRSTSSASSNLFANTSSPRFGADGPSHPYAMYPQGTIPRSPSIATTSTVQPNRNSSVRHAPQHPYAMYPQGVTEDDHLEDEDDAQAAAPAVGFPGLGQPYQRVRGPDGEEQDIIGMDGHAEQLPPYTRYPEEGPKMPILAVPGELHSRGPVAGTDPGMPLMHQHIPPPAPTPQQQRPQSMTDQSQLERHSIQDRGIDSHASLPLMERVASESTGYTEKSWKEKTWKEKRKTRFCGVQFLWLVMGICALGFIGAIVGGIMGGYATGTESGRKQAESSSSSSSSVSAAEARRIATPTVSPPTGTFKLSLTTPTNERSGCVADPSRKPAWDCDLSGPPAVAISVGVPAAPRPTDGAFFFFASSDETYEYGAQYRYMNTEFAPFVPLQETDDDDKGPAFYFSQKYDKIVILEETAFDTMPTTTTPSTPTPRRKRAEYATSNGKPKQKIVQSGDQPWLCIWNDTLIEGWIYVERAVTSNFPITPTSTPFSTPTANSTPGDASLSSYTSTPTALVSGPPMPGIDTTSTLLSGSNYITTTVTKTSFNPTASKGFLDNARRPPGSFSDKHFDGSDPSTGPQRRRRNNDWPHRRDDDHVDENDADPDDDEDDEDDIVEEVEAPDTYMTLEQYPYLIKIEERRVPDADNPPYCQQFQLLNDGNLSALTNDDGSDILFAFEENPPEYSAYDREVSVDERSILQRAATPTDGCHCQWWSE